MAKNVQKIYPLNHDAEWIDNESGVFIQYIQPVTEKPAAEVPYKETWKDQLSKIGCFTVIVISIIAFGLGFMTIFKWLFY
jgi:hypothetical protein